MNSQVTIISDLYELDSFVVEDVFNELFAYLNSDQRIEFVYDMARSFDIDPEELTIGDSEIISKEAILEEASQYFSSPFQKEFIKQMYALYD